MSKIALTDSEYAKECRAEVEPANLSSKARAEYAAAREKAWEGRMKAYAATAYGKKTISLAKRKAAL